MANVSVKPMLTYIAQHRIVHGEPGQAEPRVYEPGEEFRSSDESVVAHLRANRAIALPSELEGPKSAEEAARRQAELEAQNAEMAARIAELEAAVAAKSASSNSSKSGGKASAATDGE